MNEFAVVNGWLVETSTECDCSGGVYGHMPECGLSPIGKVDDLLRDAARAAGLAAQVARVDNLTVAARMVVRSFREVEGNRQLYDAATHRCVDLLAESLAALSPAQPDTVPTPFAWPAGDPFPAQPDTERGGGGR